MPRDIAHFLGLRSAQAAARRGTSIIERHDFVAAVERLVAETPARIVRLYDEITSNGQNETMCSALSEIATGAQDRWGRMSVVEAGDGCVLVGGRQVSRARWSRLCEAGALRPCDGLPAHVTFGERPLLYYVLGKAVIEDQATQAAREPILMTAVGR